MSFMPKSSKIMCGVDVTDKFKTKSLVENFKQAIREKKDPSGTMNRGFILTALEMVTENIATIRITD